MKTKTKPELIIGKLQERCDQLHELLDKMVMVDNHASDIEDFSTRMSPLLIEAQNFLEAEGKRKAKGGI